MRINFILLIILSLITVFSPITHRSLITRIKELNEMKPEEYIGEVMPDGHISLPEEIASELGLKPYTQVKITIEKYEHRAGKGMFSPEAKRKALAIKKYITDLGPKDLSENLREKYK